MNNEWRRAVRLFELCNNWDHATDILVNQVCRSYMEHSAGWKEVLQTMRGFDAEVRSNGGIAISLSNQRSIEVLLQMMSVLEMTENGRSGCGR